MVAAITTFEKDLIDLIKFIVQSRDMDELFSKLKTINHPINNEKIIETYLKNRTLHKTYIYKLFVIILYGLLEQYVEDAIKEYLNKCCDVCSDYKNLPKKIKDGHGAMAIRLICKLSYPKYNHLKFEDIISRLNQGLNNNLATIIPESFLQNGGNYRHEEICKMFDNLGIELETTLHKYEPLSSYLLNKYHDDQHANLFFDNTVNRIVVERNTIAHGGQQGINLLDTRGMQDIADNMLTYVKSLNNLLTDKINELLYELNTLDEFESDELYKKSTVIIPKLQNVALYKGDKLIAKRAGKAYPQYCIYSIKNLQIEGFDSEFVNCDIYREVGIELDSPTRKKCKYKLLFFRAPLKLLPDKINA